MFDGSDELGDTPLPQRDECKTGEGGDDPSATKDFLNCDLGVLVMGRANGPFTRIVLQCVAYSSCSRRSVK